MSEAGDFEYDSGEDESEDEAMGGGMREDEAFSASAEDEGLDTEDESFSEEPEEPETITVGAAMEDEAEPEGDTEDEAYDMSASSRWRADQARWGRERYARSIAADQARGVQRAQSAQRALADRIKNIPMAGRTRVSSVGSLQGAGVVTAILPNGRRSRMRIIPTVAPISEVNRLRQVVSSNERRQAAATATNSKAITALAAAQTTAVRRLTDQQVKSDKELGKRIVEGYSRLDQRITKELSGGSGSLDKHAKKVVRALRRERTRSVMDAVVLATAAPFFAAYGDRSDPFSKNNLILTGSTLGWLLGDEAIDWFAGKSEALKSVATVWSYGAFLGNGATLFFLLNDKQHERFVSGVTALDTTKSKNVVIDLSTVVATGSFDDFKAKDHLVVASLLDSADSTAAFKEGAHGQIDRSGKLTLSVDLAAAGTVNIAWIVDTQEEALVNGTATPK